MNTTKRDPLVVFGAIITAVVHVGVFGAFWLSRAHADRGPPIATNNFVEAQLVRFGKPRDLAFLPHKQGAVKPPPDAIKVAKDEHALPKPPDEKTPKDVDPLKRTHAEQFKDQADDQPAALAPNEGSLSGSRAGTATEAKGDPYILSLVDKIGTAWSIPTTLHDEQLVNLSADVCLTISSAGLLTDYKVIRKSGNSQFDSSLEAALSMIHQLDAPPDRDLQTPSGPRNLRSLATNGRLCPTLSK